MACYNNLANIALKILEYPKECNIGQVNKVGITAFKLACNNNLDTVALKILEQSNKFNIDHIVNFGNNSLTLACNNKLENVALKILEHHKECNINHIGNNINNILVLACSNKLEKVSLKILEYSDMDYDSYNVLNKKTSLQWASYHKLENVVDKLLEKLRLCKQDYKYIADIYIKYINEKVTEQITNIKEIENNFIRIKSIKNKIKEMHKKNECFTCCNENDKYMKYDCNHILSICEICINKFKKPYKCPMCCKVSVTI